MQDFIQGTFHFHSTYSHDGRSTLAEIAAVLRERGFSFCVMTDHFEDFDERKFDRYIEEIKEVNSRSDFVLVPGIEVNLSGLDTIFLPARSYAELARIASQGKDSEGHMFKVLAHPAKYPFDRVVKHLGQYEIGGVELWNQQVDGSHMPPLGLLEKINALPAHEHRRYFFGCDIHRVDLSVSNILRIPAPVERTPDGILQALIRGSFVAHSGPTGIEFRNGPGSTDFAAWFQALTQNSYPRGKFLRGVRHCLKPIYSALPRDVRHSLNDVKNAFRNKL